MKGNPMNTKRTALRTGTSYAPTTAEERTAWCGRPVSELSTLRAMARLAQPAERRRAWPGARLAFDAGAALAAFLALAFMVLAIMERAPIRDDWRCLSRGITTTALVQVECK